MNHLIKHRGQLKFKKNIYIKVLFTVHYTKRQITALTFFAITKTITQITGRIFQLLHEKQVQGEAKKNLVHKKQVQGGAKTSK